MVAKKREKEKAGATTPAPAREARISIRLTRDSRLPERLAELQRALGSRMGARVSQGQAIAYAIETTLEKMAADMRQGRLI